MSLFVSDWYLINEINIFDMLYETFISFILQPKSIIILHHDKVAKQQSDRVTWLKSDNVKWPSLSVSVSMWVGCSKVSQSQILVEVRLAVHISSLLISDRQELDGLFRPGTLQESWRIGSERSHHRVTMNFVRKIFIRPERSQEPNGPHVHRGLRGAKRPEDSIKPNVWSHSLEHFLILNRNKNEK